MTSRCVSGPRARLTVLAAAILMAGCAAPAALESEAPSNSAAATPSVHASASGTPIAAAPPPTAEPSVTALPTPGPSVVTDFGFGDILRVEVNGLAVRVSPTLSSPLAQGIERARLLYSTVWWDTNGDDPVGGVNPGWVAASVGEDQYLTLYRPTDPSEYGSWPAGGPKTLMVSGTGDYVSEPLVQHDLFDFDWAAAVHDQPSPCSFSVTLLPEDGGEPVVAIETAIDDAEQGPVSGQAGLVHTSWGASAGDPGDPLFTVSVRSGCAWAVKLAPLPHD